jgi:hypothetical protein
MGNERRRDYMVNQRVHMLYMVTWTTSLLLVAAAGATGWSLWKMSQNRPIELFGVNAYALIGVLVFIIVAAAVTLGVYAIVHTHRMLGSAYHIGMHLNRLNTGETTTPLVLREGDYFREIADEINSLQGKLAGSGKPAGAPSGPPPA